MRYLSSVGMIAETKQDTFAATNVTQALSSSGLQGGVKFLSVLSALRSPRISYVQHVTRWK